MRDPEYGYKYAKNIIKGRFPEAEPYIMKDSWHASRYAIKILANDPEWTSIKGHENGRWPEAEPYIMKDPEDILSYARDVIGGRWIEAEPHIKQSMWWTVYKAKFGIE